MAGSSRCQAREIKAEFSQWNIYGPEMTRIKLSAMCEEVRKGEMPPEYYPPMHPQAKVDHGEKSALCSDAGRLADCQDE